jgi:hypothetical protein
MSTTVTPHFDLPLKIGPLGANVVEQDSIDDVGNCVVMIVSVPFGWRDEAPEFGIEDPTMRRQPIGVPAIQQVIGSQEPRAVLIIDEHPDMYDELIDVINIGVSTVKAS